MAQKKEGTESTNKPGVKIQDLSPKKDAKGGGKGTLAADSLRNPDSVRNPNVASNQSTPKNLD
jgi:hypothetical protein